MSAILSLAAAVRRLQLPRSSLRARRAVLLLAAAALVGCGGGGDGATPAASLEPQASDVGATQQSAVNLIVDTNSPGFQASDAQRLASVNSAGAAARVVNGGSVTFTTPVPRAGVYEVYARWPRGANGVGVATFVVEHSGGLTQVNEDQQSSGGEWRSLGAYAFSPERKAVVTVRGTDGRTFAVEAVRLQLRDATARAPSFASTKLPIALADEAYSARMEAQGGTPPYRFRVIEGQLPVGLSLDEASGTISGRPARKGSSTLTLGVQDRTGAQARQELTILVDESVANIDPSAPSAPLPTNRKSRLDAQTPGASTDLSSLLTRIAGMPEGQWQRVNLNSFQAAWPAEELRELINSGNPTPSAIIKAWSSFGWDSKRGNLFLYGGGHANYRGNDTYIWRGSTQMWERGSLPSAMVQTPLGYWNAIDGADKAPASAHTYDNTLYLPVVDRFLALGGAADSNGGHYYTQSSPSDTAPRKTGPYLFDPARAHPMKVGGTTGSHVQRVAPHPEVVGGNMWSNREAWLNAASNGGPPVEEFADSCTGYAKENGRDVVYIKTYYRLWRYEIADINNPAADRWQLVGVYWYAGSGTQGTCAYDPERQLLVTTNRAANPFVFWNLANAGPGNRDAYVGLTDPANEFLPLVANGSISLRDCALDYDPVRRNFKLWCGDGRIWSLTPPATVSASGWVIQREQTPSSAVPSETIGTGILGKWKYIPNLDVFMGLLDPVAGNIWVYKPAGWVNPAGDINLPPSVRLTSPSEGQEFALGSAVALAATAADGDGSVAKVEYFANGASLGSSTHSPYGLLWQASTAGAYNLTARATDDKGAVTTSEGVTVHVRAPAPNAPPTVGWVAPADGTVVTAGTSVTLQAAAADADGTVTKVEFFVGGNKIGESAAAPFSLVWAAPPVGVHVLTAVATDDRQASTMSSVRTLTVSATPGQSLTYTLQRSDTAPAFVRETYLSSYHQTLAFGSRAFLLDRQNLYAPLIRFAIYQSEGGPVPDGATVESAVLSLYKTTPYNMNYALHRMLVDWSETEATWQRPSPGRTWASPGALGAGSDFASTPDATASVGWDSGWIDFDVTSALQQMGISGVANFGWRLRDAGGYSAADKRFASSEEAGNTALRPKLIVTISAGQTQPPIDPDPDPQPQTVTLQRTSSTPALVRETYLSSYHQTLAFGAYPVMLDQQNAYSSLMRFAIFKAEGGPVPNGARIRSAVLSLYKSTYYNMNYALHPMLVDWSEAEATWQRPSLGRTWGSPGALGAGTDFASTPDAAASVGWDPGWLEFDVTSAVQQMGAGAIVNFGWRLRDAGGYSIALKRFISSEEAGNTTLRPKLTVSYE